MQNAKESTENSLERMDELMNLYKKLFPDT